ncbi:MULTISPECIES: uracil-DNA glycosylase [unclassified Enterococcus]|uniref:uracil-DNA glycosylase n=1 Tax=unclassified Enterococcus TaxID=2608891 RepID=UPI003D2C2FC8
MNYPQELIEKVEKRTGDAPVEGFVPGQGPLNPKLMLVGEAPGKTEVTNHIPFSGQAGKELMNCLASAGLTREEVYITSAVRSRPYKKTERINKRTGQREIVYPNRTPTKSEVLAHAPILDYEFTHIDPPLIATLGNIGLHRLLGPTYTVSKTHGELYQGPILQLNEEKNSYEWSEKTYSVIPLFHPAAVFYNRKLQPLIEKDWEVIREVLQNEKISAT